MGVAVSLEDPLFKKSRPGQPMRFGKRHVDDLKRPVEKLALGLPPRLG